MKDYTITLTDRELTCLLGLLEVDEEIFKEMDTEMTTDNPDEYCRVLLRLTETFRNLKNN